MYNSIGCTFWHSHPSFDCLVRESIKCLELRLCECVDGQKKPLRGQKVVCIDLKFELVPHHGLFYAINAFFEDFTDVVECILGFSIEKEKFAEEFLFFVSN